MIFLCMCYKKAKRTVIDKAASVGVLGNKIKQILRLRKYQFINNTTIGKSESINILKFDISVIKAYP